MLRLWRITTLDMTRHDVEFKERLGRLEASARALRDYGDHIAELAMKIAQEAESLETDYANYLETKKD